MMLDDKLPVSLQFQLKEIFTDKITQHEWSVDSKIPSERELCEIYNVSRITVREVLKAMEKEGFLTRKQGKGTFVASPKIEQRLNKFYSFSEEMKKMGMKHSAKILDFSISRCNEEMAKNLCITSGDMVYKITRLRYAGDLAFAYETSYIPYSLTEQLSVKEIEEKGLYKTIHSHSGYFADTATEAFQAVIATTEVASYLGIEKNSAVLQIERFTKSQGRAIEYCICMVRGDKYSYRVTLR